MSFKRVFLGLERDILYGEKSANMNTEMWGIYMKDFSIPNCFLKQYPSLRYRQLYISCQNNWIVKGKKITYLVRGVYKNFVLKLTFSF